MEDAHHVGRQVKKFKNNYKMQLKFMMKRI